MENNDAPKRVTAIGGIFFKTENPEKMRQWYAEHLGLNTDKHGTTFEGGIQTRPNAKDLLLGVHFLQKPTILNPPKKNLWSIIALIIWIGFWRN